MKKDETEMKKKAGKSRVGVKTVMPGVTLREGPRGRSVRFGCMVERERFSKTCELPAAVLVDDKGHPTKLLREEYARWICEQRERKGYVRGMGLRVPTMRELVEAWEKMAWKRNRDPEYRKPGERSIVTALRNVGYCVEKSGVGWDRPYTEVCDIDVTRRVFKKFREEGKTGVSANSYLVSLQSVTAKWTIAEYRDLGYDVKPTLLPDFGRSTVAKQYKRLPPERIAAINAWYARVRESANEDMALGVTIIYNLAIRPNDIGALTKENFVQGENGHWRLNYVPQKTSESSGRKVDIEIPDELFETIRNLAGARWETGETLLSCWRYTFVKINTSMRIECDMPVSEWPKAAYELRKLCLDTVMRQQGIEQAIKLSGDRRETLEHYYVDPYKGTVPLMMVAPAVGAATAEK